MENSGRCSWRIEEGKGTAAAVPDRHDPARCVQFGIGRSRPDRTVGYGSYREFQRYLCKDCGRTFNDKTGTIFEHSKVALRKWLFSIYAFLWFNTSLRQIQCEIDVSYQAVLRRVERFTRALDAPTLDVTGPVEIDELYVPAGLKGREREWSRSRALRTDGRGTYSTDKPPIFLLVDRGTDRKWTIPAKTVDFDTVRLLLAVSQQESLTVYTDGYLSYKPLERHDAFTRKYVVHSEGEYADGETHINTAESHASLARRWLSPHRGLSKDRLTQYFRAFELRRQLYRKPGRQALKDAIRATL